MDEKLKTSQEWYELDSNKNIVDPDGWRDLPNGTQGLYWHTEKIAWSEFYSRKRKCTITTDIKKIPNYPYFQTLVEWKKANSIF